MAIFGLGMPIVKLGLQDLPPIFMLAGRFALTALVLVPFVPIPRAQLPGIVLLSVIMAGLHFPLMFTALQQLDGAAAAIAIQTQVPFGALLAAMLFKDFIGWRRAVGMALSFAGVVVMAGEPRVAGQWLALLMVIAAAAAFAVGNIQVKLIGEMNVFALNGWMCLIGVPILMTGSAVLEDGQWQAVTGGGWAGWGTVVYLALMVSIVGHGQWYGLLARYPVNQTMPFLLLVPVFAVAGSILLLGETLTWPLLLGGGFTILGVAIIVLRRPKAVETRTGTP